ncbi:hypothetical protein CH35J_010947 [Colletotrichum higginsianum]|uniref:Uncharacterized protein n=1 Tax=Colletotrichum higginsianum TaxID=80884 RepID=A0A4T0VI59_9PEZI|nr:hypothetical protein CH35J_010947 [Colletotrichum higginsianum]
MPPRQRIETEADVAAELSQLRQVAHGYANPGIDISDRDHSQWDFSSFLCSQLSDDEVGNLARVVFAPERTWYRSAASVECRKRFDAVKNNLGYQSVEHTLNSLANAKDKAKRKTDAEIRAAINAAAATRHANNPGACNNAESLAVEWTPEDFEAAFKEQPACSETSSPFVAWPSPVRRPAPPRKRPLEELNYEPPSSKRARIAASAVDGEEEEKEGDALEDCRGGAAPKNHEFGFFDLGGGDETGGSSREMGKGKGNQTALDPFNSEEEDEEEEGEEEEEEEDEHEEEDDDDIKIVEA